MVYETLTVFPSKWEKISFCLSRTTPTFHSLEALMYSSQQHFNSICALHVSAQCRAVLLSASELLRKEQTTWCDDYTIACDSRTLFNQFYLNAAHGLSLLTAITWLVVTWRSERILLTVPNMDVRVISCWHDAMHNTLIAVLKLDLTSQAGSDRHINTTVVRVCRGFTSANCSSLSDVNDDKMMCSVQKSAALEID